MLRVLWLALLTALALGGQAQAAWHKAESKHFIIYGEGSASELRSYAEKLEAFDWLLRAYHKPVQEDAPRKLEIYLVQSSHELTRVFPDRTLDGIYHAGDQAIFAVALKADSAWRDDVMLHEYVHHFMDQYFPYSYPRWLVEGWAEYFQTAEINGDQIDVGKPHDAMQWTFSSDDMLSLRSVIGYSGGTLAWDHSWEFYAWSWLLTHYMLADPERKAKLNTYLRAVSAGDDPAAAFQNVVGMDARALTLRLRNYAGRELKFTRIKGVKLAPGDVTVTELPASADALLLELQQLKTHVAPEHRQALLKRVREQASAFPGDRLADFALARAEILYGDRAKGETILRRYLAADGEDLEALRLMAQSQLASAADSKDPAAAKAFRANARKHLTRAYQLDPEHYQTLYAYGLAQKAEQATPSENTLNVLLLAHQLAPQVGVIRLTAAETLMLRQRYAEAAAILGPLANSPHKGEHAGAARTMLEEINKRQATPAPG